MDKPVLIYKCEKCNYETKYLSSLNKHLKSELHKTGIRKIRIDTKPPHKCIKCEYSSKNIIMFKQHMLNLHGTLEERKIGFNFYCEICDYGTFSVDLFNNHNESNKHKKYMERKNI